MGGFCEYEFQSWLDRKVGFSIRKHWKESETNESRDQRVQDLIDDLTPMELVCYLGEYLTTE